MCLWFCRVNHEISHIASVMPTPSEIHGIEEITAKGIFIPPVFVVQIHVPSPQNVMHMKRDGPGVTFVMYFTLSKVQILISLYSNLPNCRVP